MGAIGARLVSPFFALLLLWRVVRGKNKIPILICSSVLKFRFGFEDIGSKVEKKKKKKEKKKKKTH